MKHKSLWRITLICLAFMTVFAVGKSFMLDPVVLNLPEVSVTVLNDDWDIEPMNQNDDAWESYTYTVRENTPDPLMLSVKSFCSSFRVYLDEEQIYDYEDAWDEKGVVRHWITLPPHIEGSRLTIQGLADDEYFDLLLSSPIYLGRQNTILIYFLLENLYAIIFGAVSLLISLFMICCGAYLRGRDLQSVPRAVGLLGGFILSAGCWVVLDSQILQLLTNRTGVVYILSFLALLVMPIFLLQFLQQIFREKKPSMDILSCLYAAAACLCLLSYVIRAAGVYEALMAAHVLIVISIVVVMKNCIDELRRHRNPEMRRILAGFICLAVFSLAALVVYHINLTGGYQYLYCIGIFIFIVIMIQVAFMRLGYYIKRNAEVNAYKRLAHMDPMTHMRNRAAFMKEQEHEQGADDAAQCLAYIIMDINNLKAVNDQYGHQEGDYLIIDAASCIQKVFGERGLCFRIGGDEFAVVLVDQSVGEIKASLEQLREEVRNVNERREFPLEIAAGYAFRTDRSKSIAALYEEADIRMYEDKQRMKRERLLAAGEPTEGGAPQ